MSAITTLPEGTVVPVVDRGSMLRYTVSVIGHLRNLDITVSMLRGYGSIEQIMTNLYAQCYSAEDAADLIADAMA